MTSDHVLLEYPEGTPFPGVVGRELADSQPAWPAPRRARPGSPNVVFVVLDDVGYAQLGCFGSDIDTPNFDRLAAGGLRYRNFHTTAMCSPTRACLLTGRNHHTTAMGGIADTATGFPGYNGRIPRSCGFLPEVLLEEGYATYAVGKWHLAPREETDLGSSRARWPLGRGFERFYGFLGAETNQWAPELVVDNHVVEVPERDGYHLSEDLADQAIGMIGDLRNAAPGKPFFLYLAFGACHAPHQAPPEWIEPFRGRFDQGWDAWRAETHARQLAMGILPPGTELTERPPWIAAWDTLDDEAKGLYARMMELFAGFLAHTDAQLGRVLDAIESYGELEDTIVVVISDNGASPEGGPHGSFNSTLWFNGVPETVEMSLPYLDRLGGPETHSHYPYGWAHAGNTPFQKWKRETHEGGIADPLIVHWPAGIEARGEIRGQYAHAIDVVPTVLEALGLTMPPVIAGVPQDPVAGVSLLPTFAAPEAPDRHRTQYYELLGCRAIYHDGWKAVAYHAMAGQLYDGVSDPKAPFDADRWELYHVAQDFSESNDLAAAEPARLREMIERWWVEAGRYGALPLHSSRGVDTPRPRTVEPRRRYRYRPGSPVATPAAVDVRHRPHVVLADITVPAEGAEGVIVAHGGRFGGYSLYLCDGYLRYAYNTSGLDLTIVQSGEPLLRGARLRVGYAFDPVRPLSATVRMFVGDDEVGRGDIAEVVRFTYSLFGDYFCCGFDDGTPVSTDYESPFRFTGTVHEVVVDVSGEPYRDVAMEWEAAVRSQ
jgi:arylsulfatase